MGLLTHPLLYCRINQQVGCLKNRIYLQQAFILALTLVATQAQADTILEWCQKSWSFEQTPAFQKDFNAFKGDLNSERDSNGQTALFWAAQRGHHDVATLLLLRGADPNFTNASKDTPIHAAAAAGHDFMIRLLFLKGGNLNAVDNAGFTPMARALQARHYRCMEVLLSLGAEISVPGVPPEISVGRLAVSDKRATQLIQSFGGGNPAITSPPALSLARDSIQTAAKRGDFDTVLDQIAAGKNINELEPGPDGATALHRAIQGAYDDMVLCLLAAGADPNVTDAKGKSPLMWTMGWHGFSFDRMRDYLLLKGAKITTVTKDGWTELTFATNRGNLYGMQELIGLGLDPKARTNNGTPLEIAFNNGDQRAIDLLRANGVIDPLPVRNDPVWNLHNATKRGDLATVQKLLQAGLKIDVSDDKGNSPLMNAIAGRQLEVADWLIQQGADINYVNPKSGWTPLFISIIWNYYEMTQFRKKILQAGAKPNVASNSGETPLMRSLWHQPETPFLQLLQYGADINAKNKEGKSVVQIAVAKGYLEDAEYLKKLGATE